MQITNQHLLSTEVWDKENLNYIIRLASALTSHAQKKSYSTALAGKILANVFYEPSTRTRLSFATAFIRLGGQVIDVQKQFSSLDKGESYMDTARTLNQYADAICIRHSDRQIVPIFASECDVPVINAGDGDNEHPTQALLDIYGMHVELGKDDLQDTHIAIIGDLKHGRTIHSLIPLLALYPNCHLTFIAPKDLALPDQYYQLLQHHQGNISTFHELPKQKHGFDIIYMTRIQQERLSKGSECQGIDLDLHYYQQYADNAILMHPLPRDEQRNIGFAYDLDSHSKFTPFRQVQRGIAMRMAIFVLLFAIEDQLHE